MNQANATQKMFNHIVFPITSQSITYHFKPGGLI